jgi:hypothetical protein
MNLLVLEGGYWLTRNTIICLEQDPAIRLFIVSRAKEKSFLQLSFSSKRFFWYAGAEDDVFLEYLKEIAKSVDADVFLPIDEAGFSKKEYLLIGPSKLQKNIRVH